MVPECEERIKDILEKEEDIVLAYLFGSYARDDITSLSDIDIGILFNSGIDSLHRHNIKLKLIGEIAQACKVNKIDIVDMEKGSILLKYNIIKHGKILKSADEDRRVLFETSIISRYLDEKYYLQRHSGIILKRMASSGLA